MQFLENHEWIPVIGARYQMGADGVAVLLIVLTTLLGVIAALSSWNYIQKREKEYYVLLLLLQAAVVGVFSSMDLFCSISSLKYRWCRCISSLESGAAKIGFTQQSSFFSTRWWFGGDVARCVEDVFPHAGHGAHRKDHASNSQFARLEIRKPRIL